MEGIITNPRIEESDLVDFVSAAWKGETVGVVTPSKEENRSITIQIKESASSGYSCIDIDVAHSGYQLNSTGFEALKKGTRQAFFNAKTDSPDAPICTLGTELLTIKCEKG